jgi:hypothetical protein
MIKLEPHPDYPVLAKNDFPEDEEEFAQGMEMDGPYDENGLLEVCLQLPGSLGLYYAHDLMRDDHLLRGTVD